MSDLIKGFVTRADAGLRRPKSVSYNIDPSQDGVCIHYGGPAQRLNQHAECLRRWKAWQDYHMDTHGWADLAYNGGACDHGYALAGRGLGVRSAANGTNEGNSHYYAFVWLGGDGETPTEEAIRALAWWYREAQRAGKAADDIQPHWSFRSTSCCGKPLHRRFRDIQSLSRDSSPKEEPMSQMPGWAEESYDEMYAKAGLAENQKEARATSNLKWYELAVILKRLKLLDANTDANAVRRVVDDALKDLRITRG